MKPRTRSLSAATASLLVALCLLATPHAAPAQVQITTRALDLEFSGRVQFQLQTSSCTDATPEPGSACTAEAPGLDMFLRRARVSVEATIDDRLSLKLEPDFSDVGGASLKDAWGRYAFSSGLAVKAGHFKRPFDGFHLTSSSQLPFERAVEVPGVSAAALSSYSGLTEAAELSDRDIGFMLEGSPGGGAFTYWLGVFTGGSDSDAEDTNTEKQFVGRAQIALDAGEAPLRVAGAVAFTDRPYVAADGETRGEYYADFELWAELGAYDRGGLLVQTGFLAGDNPRLNQLGSPLDPTAGDEFAALFAWQGVGAYRLPVAGGEWLEAVAPLLRVSYGDPSDVDGDEAWGFTPGFTLYFHERNRLALMWDIASFTADGIATEHSFKAQMQFHF